MNSRNFAGKRRLRLIENSLRGIDLLCLYRPNTACIFLPGCSLEAVTQRAGECCSR